MMSFAEARSTLPSAGMSGLRVLFRAPAGARRGYGHLVRCRSLARALGVRPLVALRGGGHASDVALALGTDLLASPSLDAMRRLAPDVVIVDDPNPRHARRWIAAARRTGALVVTVHDLGLGAPEGDLVIDGSVARAARARKGSVGLAGTRFAVLDPGVLGSTPAARTLSGPRGEPDKARPTAAPRLSKTVLIALGGGPHAQTAGAIARAMVAADPSVEVRIAGGFAAGPRTAHPRVCWTVPRRGLASELRDVDLAVVGGGMSLYEACAMGVPAVALPVVAAQRPTVRAFAARGAAMEVPPRAKASAAAAVALRLLNDRTRRAGMARRSMQLVDGRGAFRAAAAVAALTQGR